MRRMRWDAVRRVAAVPSKRVVKVVAVVSVVAVEAAVAGAAEPTEAVGAAGAAGAAGDPKCTAVHGAFALVRACMVIELMRIVATMQARAFASKPSHLKPESRGSRRTESPQGIPERIPERIPYGLWRLRLWRRLEVMVMEVVVVMAGLVVLVVLLVLVHARESELVQWGSKIDHCGDGRRGGRRKRKWKGMACFYLRPSRRVSSSRRQMRSPLYAISVRHCRMYSTAMKACPARQGCLLALTSQHTHTM